MALLICCAALVICLKFSCADEFPPFVSGWCISAFLRYSSTNSSREHPCESPSMLKAVFTRISSPNASARAFSLCILNCWAYAVASAGVQKDFSTPQVFPPWDISQEWAHEGQQVFERAVPVFTCPHLGQRSTWYLHKNTFILPPNKKKKIDNKRLLGGGFSAKKIL